jgi:hypothetical protein
MLVRLLDPGTGLLNSGSEDPLEAAARVSMPAMVDNAPMSAGRSTTDPAFRADVANALARHGELCVAYIWSHRGGSRAWFLICDLREFDAALPWPGQPSDRVDVFLDPPLPVRGVAGDPALVDQALALLDTAGELLLATVTPDDPRLHQERETDEADDVREWFTSIQAGRQVVIGPHPFLTFEDPTAALVAYVPQPDGRIVPGAY